MASAIVFAAALLFLGFKFLRARTSRDLVRIFCVLGIAISAGGTADGVERYYRLAHSAALNDKYKSQSEHSDATLLKSLKEIGTNETALTVVEGTQRSLRSSHESFWALIEVARQNARAQAIAFGLTFMLFGVTLIRTHRESGAN